MTRERGMKLNRQRRAAKGAVMRAEEYRELIQLHVDQARSDLSIAERLSEEVRLRFGADIDLPTETE